jgi:hypothetical protein
MNPTVRHIAVSGSALVALLGGAAAITAACAPTASATEMQTAIDRATGAPVTLPDGRTTYVRGMDAAAYNATPEQHTVILAAATGQQAGYNQQVTTQAGGGTVAVGIVAILVLGIVVFFRVKKHDLKPGDAVLVGLFGIALSGTFIGAMGTQLTNSAVGSLGSMLGSLG